MVGTLAQMIALVTHGNAFLDLHSHRKADIGSTRDARRAGRYPATADAPLRTTVARTIDAGSIAERPNSRLETSLVSATAATKPPAVPIISRTNVSRIISHWTLPGLAPNANRIPTSAVLRFTE